MDYFYQLINLIRRWSRYFGLTDRQDPEDIFFQLLHDKNYEAALELARKHERLDIDLVYKCQWRNSGITVQSIHTVLSGIQDKLWSINECVQTIPISYNACRALIEFGLKEANLRLLYQLGNETFSSAQPKSDAKRNQSKQPLLPDNISDDEIEGLVDFENLNDQQKELCRCRQDLLRHEHSLFAYESILGDYRIVQQQFDHVFYDEFRQKCPLNAVIDYAHEGDSHAVEILLNFYTNDLKPHFMGLLSNFPETLSPYQYRNLLPCLREGDSYYEWRALAGQIKRDEFDWSCNGQSSSFTMSLKNLSETYEKEFYDENPNLHKYMKPLTADVLTEWYIERALEMESRTLLLSNAIQLLHLGIELNIANLQATHDDLIEFSRIIYDYCTDATIYLSYSEFNKMAELGMQKDFTDYRAKYKLLAFALVKCEDSDGSLSAKILDHVIESRKRDERIQIAYLQQHM